MSVLSAGERAVAEGVCNVRGGHRWGPVVGGERRCRVCDLPEGYFLSAPSPARTAMLVYWQPPSAGVVGRRVPEPVVLDPEPRGWSVPWLLVVVMVAALAVVRIGALL